MTKILLLHSTKHEYEFYYEAPGNYLLVFFPPIMFCRKQQQSTNTVQNNVRSFTANRHRVIRSLARYVKVSLSERPSLSQLLSHGWKATPCSPPQRASHRARPSSLGRERRGRAFIGAVLIIFDRGHRSH